MFRVQYCHWVSFTYYTKTLRAQFPIFMYMYNKLMYMQVSKCLVCACIFEFIILLQVKFPINICLYFEVDHINDQIVWPSTKTSLLNWFLSTLSRLPCRLSLQNVAAECPDMLMCFKAARVFIYGGWEFNLHHFDDWSLMLQISKFAKIT